MDTPNLKELAEFLRIKRDEKAALNKTHDLVIAELDAVIDGLKELIQDTFAEGVTAQSVTLADGFKASLTKKKNPQFRLNAGESDAYYAWAKEHGRTDLFQRRIAQDAMEAEVVSNGLPPGVFVRTETVIGMTLTRPAPTV